MQKKLNHYCSSNLKLTTSKTWTQTLKNLDTEKPGPLGKQLGAEKD